MNAARRVKRAQDLLKQIGLEPERVQMFNMSSAMAGEFVSTAQEMTRKIENLGLNPLRKIGFQESNSLSEKDSTAHPMSNPEPEESK